MHNASHCQVSDTLPLLYVICTSPRKRVCLVNGRFLCLDIIRHPSLSCMRMLLRNWINFLPPICKMEGCLVRFPLRCSNRMQLISDWDLRGGHNQSTYRFRLLSWHISTLSFCCPAITQVPIYCICEGAPDERKTVGKILNSAKYPANIIMGFFNGIMLFGFILTISVSEAYL